MVQMIVLKNLLKQLNSIRVYYSGVNIVALVLVFYHFDGTAAVNLDKLTLLYAMAGSVILLSYWTIILPPTGYSFSMDSSIYIASLFLFGLDYTLLLLVISSIGDALFNYKKHILKHLTNFSIYAVCLIVAFYLFSFSGGEIQFIDTENIYPYAVSLLGFSLTNTLSIALYYSIYTKTTFSGVIKEMFFGSYTTYFTTLLLSLVLSMLIGSYQIFGLFLYVTIAVLLAITFKKYHGIYEDISKKATIDYRTGLYNHGYFEEHLELKLKEAKDMNVPLSLVLMDIDDFKKYNDHFGHYEGDQLLEFIGQHLKKCFDYEDFTVARYGGEEFAVLLPNVEKTQAFHLVDQARKSLNDSYYKGAEVFPYGCISFSAGVAQYEKGMYDTSQIIEYADQAMYAAKRSVKNQVLIYPEHNDFKAYELEEGTKYLEKSLNFFLGKDVYTYKHSKRVYKYAVEFGEKLNLDKESKEILSLGALIHDIGKIEVPRIILTKQGKLTEDEWEMVKKHVTWGKEMILSQKNLKELVPLVELHHERYDGKGYPHGLKGEEIPKLARILCIIDSFDAMTTERPYQKTKTFEEGLIELKACSREQFDPEFVESFVEMIEERYLRKANEDKSETLE
jgi:diguanylate cyclase (GGDEF)-like protein/putative nucleotidyltransferase with HDIG domain